MNATDTGSELTANQADKLQLDVVVKEKSPCERHVIVKIPAEEVERYRRKEFDEIVPKAEMPGFRKGKAPRKLVEARFRDQVDERVKAELVMESLEQVTEGNYFTPISEPAFDFEAIDLPDEGDFTYEFDIEVRPDFETPEWKGLKLERPVVTLTDEIVDQRLSRALAELVPGRPVDGPCEPGDEIIVDLQVRHKGKLIAEAEGLQIVVRKNLLFNDVKFEGFSDAVAGKKPGEKVTLRATVSELVPDEELRGQEIEAEFTIKEIRRLELDALESEDLSDFGFDSVSELREYFRQQMEQQIEYAQRSRLREQITDQLTAGANWELPPSVVERQTHRELRRMALELQRSGLDDATIRKFLAARRLDARKATERALREHFILEKIGDELNLEPTEQEYQQEIEALAERTESTPRAVRLQLERSGEMDALRNEIIERKVIERIIAEAEVTEVEDPELLTRVSEDYAVDFSVNPEKPEIPEAKYADEAPQRPNQPKLPEKEAE